MRKNMESVLRSFDREQEKTGETCSTDGKVIRSYQTPIAFRRQDGKLVLNASHYSKTTTTQQTAFRVWYSGFEIIELPETEFNKAMQDNGRI